jgi:hypothetical protein
MVCPQVRVMAAESKAGRTVRTVDAKMLDIALGKGGKFTGRVVDHTGVPLDGAEVTVKLGETEVARTVTDRSGTFTVSDLKNGIYTINSGATVGTYRLWTEKTAPPSANPQGLLITGQNGARGQYAAVDSSGNLLIVVIALTALGVGIATLIEVEDIKGKIPTSP